MPEECVSFEAWVEWVFTRAHKEFHGELPDRSELERIPRATRAEYFARLLENSDQYADKYNEDQIADAVWHLFGVDGSYWGNLDCPHYYGSMPNDDAMNALARRCLLAVPKIYRDLFARVCDDWGRSRHIDLSDTRRVDVAVYMIWDMDQLQYFAMSTPDRKILAWKVLAEILEIDSYTCRKSALHGLGHLACNHNSESRTIVNDFLRSHPNLPTSLRSYAECARDGAVM